MSAFSCENKPLEPVGRGVWPRDLNRFSPAFHCVYLVAKPWLPNRSEQIHIHSSCSGSLAKCQLTTQLSIHTWRKVLVFRETTFTFAPRGHGLLVEEPNNTIMLRCIPWQSTRSAQAGCRSFVESEFVIAAAGVGVGKLNVYAVHWLPWSGALRGMKFYARNSTVFLALATNADEWGRLWAEPNFEQITTGCWY